MKLLHTADWHIGRTLNGYSLLTEQKAIFQQILEIARTEKVDGIVIAGDIYDRAVPATEAVTALDQMLQELNLHQKLPIYMIAGNHDGAKRLNFGRNWMKQADLYLNTLLAEAFHPIETPDAQIFLLPFFDPIDARVYYRDKLPEEEVKKIHSIGTAMELVLADLQKLFKPGKKHLLVTHFAVTPNKETPINLTSETTSTVGGLDTLTANQFAAFDYVMLGHIHTRFASPSKIIRYAGSPVKFNVKEAATTKSVDIIELTDQTITTKSKNLTPETNLIVLKETWETLLDPQFYQQQPVNQDWFAITIKDFDRSQHVHSNVRAQLQDIYGTVVELDYQNIQKNNLAQNNAVTENINDLSEEAVVNNFFETITDQPLSEMQQALVEDIFVSLKKGE